MPHPLLLSPGWAWAGPSSSRRSRGRSSAPDRPASPASRAPWAAGHSRSSSAHTSRGARCSRCRDRRGRPAGTAQRVVEAELDGLVDIRVVGHPCSRQ
jgi:hypothetical protein